MPGSLRIEKWPACKVYFSCVTTESSYYWKIKKKNPKTKTPLVKRTVYWVGVGKKWRKEEGISDQIESYEPVNLNKLLRCRDFITKNNKQRLRVWQSQKLWWQLWTGIWKRKDIPVLSFIRDRQFSSLKQVFVGKAKQLHCTCKSSRLQKAFKQRQEGNFFLCLLLKSNHVTFLVQFGIYSNSWVFQKVQIAYTRIFKLFEKNIHTNISQMNSKLYNYIYKSCCTA